MAENFPPATGDCRARRVYLSPLCVVGVPGGAVADQGQRRWRRDSEVTALALGVIAFEFNRAGTQRVPSRPLSEVLPQSRREGGSGCRQVGSH